MEHKIEKPSKFVDSLIFKDETGCDLFIRDENWYISGEITAEQAQNLLDNHNPQKPQEQSVLEKLNTLGLTVDDLKAALGL